MAAEQFVSKYTAAEIEAMLDKVKQDMTVIQYTQEQIYSLLQKIDGFNISNIPSKTSDLTNDSNFITATVNNLANYYQKSEVYTQTEVNQRISEAASGGFIRVDELPTENISTKGIYLVPSQTTKTKNIYDEYINLDGTVAGYEMIGDTKIDLTGYATTQALNDALRSYVTTNNLTLALADYVTSQTLSTTLNDYLLSSTFTNALNNYYTKTEVDNLLNPGSNEEPDPEPETPDPQEPENPDDPNNNTDDSSNEGDNTSGSSTEPTDPENTESEQNTGE